MSVNLSLLPLYSKTSTLSLNVLRLNNPPEGLGELAQNIGYDVPREGISSYLGRNGDGENAWGESTEDCYGNRLKTLTAKELTQFFSENELRDWEEKAVAAYLSHLPDDLPVVLFWE